MSLRQDIFELLDDGDVDILKSVTSGDCVLGDREQLHKFVPVCDPTAMSTADVQLFVKLVLDAHSWFLGLKRCLPRNDVLVRLSSASHLVQVEIDLNCSAWTIDFGGHHQRGFFDPVAKDIRNILKRTFPAHASDDPRSMWRAGAMAELKRRFAGVTQPTNIESTGNY